MTGPVAGWYPDPEDASVRRWWDGTQWAAPPVHAETPQPLASPGGWQPPVSMPMSVPSVSGYQAPFPSAPASRLASPPRYAQPPVRRHTGNTYAITTLVVCAAYLALAMTTRIVIFGILPAAMTVRSFAARERLAPLAALATVIVIGVAVAYYRR